MRSGGSYIRHGGGSWRGSHSIYRTPRHLGSYDRSARRYAYNAWRGDIGGRRGSFRHGKRFRHDEFAFRHGKRFRHHDFDRRHHRRFRRFVGYGFPYYDDYGYYAGGCGWLYRRALITRSPYWWNRYYACINYNYWGEFILLGTERDSDGVPWALLASDRDGRLEFAGPAILSPPQALRAAWRERMAALAVAKPPVRGLRQGSAQWLRPELRVRVKHLKAKGILRHASVKGLITD
jgi:hypothetical protein